MNAAVWDRAQADRTPAVGRWSMALAAGAVAMLAIYSQGWVYPLFGEGPGVVAASGLIRALFFPAYLMGFVLIAAAPAQTLRAMARQPFLIAVLLIVAASYVWSIAPDQTARRVFAVYCTSLGGIVLAVRYRWSEMAEIMGACFAILALLSLAVCLAAPSVGVMQTLFPGAWRGLWAEKNAFGANMGLGFVIFVAAAALNAPRRGLWIAFAVLALGLVLMSTSKTSLVSLLLGLGGFALAAFARRGPAAGVAAAWVSVFGLLLVAGAFLFSADTVLAVLGKDATLTGRTQIWTAAMRQVAERPLTGFGYGTVWGESGPWGPLAKIVSEAGFKPNHAHNSWVEQWLGTGIVGLVAFSLTFAQAVVLCVVAVFRDRGAMLAAPILVVYGLMTFTESVGVVYNDLRWVLFVAIAVKLAWPDREVAA